MLEGFITKLSKKILELELPVDAYFGTEQEGFS